MAKQDEKHTRIREGWLQRMRRREIINRMKQRDDRDSQNRWEVHSPFLYVLLMTNKRVFVDGFIQRDTGSLLLPVKFWSSTNPKPTSPVLKETNPRSLTLVTFLSLLPQSAIAKTPKPWLLYIMSWTIWVKLTPFFIAIQIFSISWGFLFSFCGISMDWLFSRRQLKLPTLQVTNCH